MNENSTESVYQLLHVLGYLEDKGKTTGQIAAMLKKFYFVGITEKSGEDFLYLYSLLNINKFFINQNVSKKFAPQELSRSTANILSEKNNIDEKIYKRALD